MFPRIYCPYHQSNPPPRPSCKVQTKRPFSSYSRAHICPECAHLHTSPVGGGSVVLLCTDDSTKRAPQKKPDIRLLGWGNKGKQKKLDGHYKHRKKTSLMRVGVAPQSILLGVRFTQLRPEDSFLLGKHLTWQQGR